MFRTSTLSVFVLAALMGLMIAASANATVTILNPNFDPPDEDTSDNPNPGYGPISDWASGGGAGVNPAGGGADPFLGSSTPNSGTHVAFQQQVGTISQTATGFVPGKKYTLQYFENERGLGGAIARPYAKLGGVNVVPEHDAVDTPLFRRVVGSAFTATSASHTIVLGNDDPTQGTAADRSGDNTALFDTVQITRAVPAQAGGIFGGFEGLDFADNSFTYNPVGDAWTYDGNSGLSDPPSAFGGITAPEGGQYAFLQGSTAMISDIFDGFEDGVTYSLSFEAAGRTTQNGPNDFKVLLDGEELTFGGSSTVLPGGGAFSTFTSDEFSTTGGSHTLTFMGLNTGGGDQTSFLDDVRFNFVAEAAAVPGPATAMLGLLALGGLGAVTRRRRA